MAQAELSTALSATEWQEFLTFARDLHARMNEDRAKLAAFLGRMSRPQLKAAWRELRWLGTMDALHKLAMAGRGEISLKVAELAIPASVLRRCKPDIRDALTPEREVTVLTPRGVKLKRLADLNALEAVQVVHPDRGIVPAEKQCLAWIEPAKPTAKPDAFEDMERIRPGDDGFVYVVGALGAKIRIPARSLRGLLK